MFSQSRLTGERVRPRRLSHILSKETHHLVVNNDVYNTRTCFIEFIAKTSKITITCNNHIMFKINFVSFRFVKLSQ